jgi:tetratricopeptide (TPR) repeat protein
MRIKDCVSEAELRAFQLGELPARVADRVATHLETCPSCAALAERTDAALDPCVLLLRRAVGVAASTNPPRGGADPTEATPAPAPVPPGHEHFPRPFGDFELLGELGRGGMGVVYLARQRHPARTVALKLLLAGTHAGAERRARFLAEADAIGRLQHPHIVQIHEAGECDGQLYLALEYADGGSLARHLGGRPQDPAASAALVEQLARAVQYAHDSGVVHRDLKPGNVLLQGSGVWGLGSAGGDSGTTTLAPKIADFGLARLDEASLTSSGAMLGTPGYMAPEQAAGQKQAVGPAADIYALGAILYEMLTGRPPFRAATVLETLEQVRTHEVVPPRRHRPGLSADLNTICLKCLHKEPGRRYASALALAEDLGRFRAAEPIRARPVGLLERLWKWARKRPAQAALAAVLVLLTVSAVASALWYVNDRAGRQLEEALRRQEATARAEQLNRRVREALDEAVGPLARLRARLEDPLEAAALLGDLPRWKDDVDAGGRAWQRAQGLSAGNEALLEAPLPERLRAVETRWRAEERAYRLAEELEEIRLGAGALVDGKYLPGRVGEKYEAFFTRLGLDPLRGPPAQVAAALRLSPIRFALVAALDHWAHFSDLDTSNRHYVAPVLLRVAREADPDPWRDRLRQWTAWGDPDALRALAAEVDMTRQSPPTLALLAQLLERRRGHQAAVLQAALLYHPQDFWLHFDAAALAKDPAERAARYQAVLAVRPRCSAALHNLGAALNAEGQRTAALVALRKALAIDPHFAEAHYNVGHILHELDDLAGAAAAYREAIACDPTFAPAYSNLGMVLRKQREPRAAVTVLRRAVELEPHSALFHYNLGVALFDLDDLDGAEAEYRKAVKLKPYYAQAHVNLGVVLRAKQDPKGALASFRQAVEIDPDFAEAHADLGATWRDLHDLPRASAAYYRALALRPDLEQAIHGLGLVLRDHGDLPGAVAAFLRTLALNPRYLPAWTALGTTFTDLGDFPDAIAAFREALALDGDVALTHAKLGRALHLDGDPEGAMAAYRKAVALDPGCAPALNNLGLLLRDQKDLAGAAACFEQALAVDPSYAPAYVNLGLVLQGRKDLRGAAAAYRRALELEPEVGFVASNLGLALYHLNDLAGARDALARALDLDPTLAEAHLALGLILRRQGDFAGAWRALQQAHTLGTQQWGWKEPSGLYLAWAQRLLQLRRRDPAVSATAEDARRGLHGTLGPGDPFDVFQTTLKHFRKSYLVPLRAGQAYCIDLAGDFDVFLRVEGAYYLTLAMNSGKTPPVRRADRLIFTPAADGIYRLVATSFRPGGGGSFTLTVREVDPPTTDLRVPGELKPTTPTSGGKHRQIHKLELVAGRSYVFEMDGERLDSFLALVGPDGKQILLQNAGAGDFVQRARLDFTPAETGTYLLLATSTQPGETGPYTLRLRAYQIAEPGQRRVR